MECLAPTPYAICHQSFQGGKNLAVAAHPDPRSFEKR
jgi:hypothetical protein